MGRYDVANGCLVIQNDLKCSEHCHKAVNTANRVWGMIRRSFSVRDKDVILQLYKSLVRPYLEYSIQAWRPHYQKDIDLIEGVQRRATNLFQALKKVHFSGGSLVQRFRVAANPNC